MSWAYKLTPEAVRKLRDLGPSATAEIKAYLETRIKGSSELRLRQMTFQEWRGWQITPDKRHWREILLRQDWPRNRGITISSN